MRKLIVCPRCSRHVFGGDSVCPFCGSAMRPYSLASKALRLGGAAAAIVAVAACGAKTEGDESVTPPEASTEGADSNLVDAIDNESGASTEGDAAFQEETNVPEASAVDAVAPVDASGSGDATSEEADASEELDASYFGDEMPQRPPPPYMVPPMR